MKLTAIREFAWTEDYSIMKTLTCRNHQTAAYMTKNPFTRGIHVIRLPEGDIERLDTGECTCPFSDLVVIEEDDDE